MAVQPALRPLIDQLAQWMTGTIPLLQDKNWKIYLQGFRRNQAASRETR